jgi:predicted ferric reductase
LGRGFGIGAYLALTGLTLVGLWLRHPWRVAWPRPTAQTIHHVHAVLAPLTLLLVIGHVVALAVDRYAGVGWRGTVVPGASGFRPLAVALGTLSVYAGLVVGLTATLAGWVGGRVWLPVHRLAVGVLGLTWLHAVLAGTDERALMPMYLVSAAAVVLLGASRRLARPPRSMMEAPQDWTEGRR